MPHSSHWLLYATFKSMKRSNQEHSQKLKCKNCNLLFKGNFCPRCGQNASVRRFDFKYFLRESFISSLDIENGFFSTIKSLTLNPGESLREYLQGKRLSLTVPMRYLIVMGAIAAFITIRYKVFVDEGGEGAPLTFLNFMDKEFWDYANEFITILNIVAVPVFAFFSYTFFKRTGFNFSENLIMNMYITAHQLFILLIFFPFIEIFLAYKSTILYIYPVVTIIYNFWAYLSFFRRKNFFGIVITLLAMAAAYIVQLFSNYGIFLILKSLNLIPQLQKIDLPG